MACKFHVRAATTPLDVLQLGWSKLKRHDDMARWLLECVQENTVVSTEFLQWLAKLPRDLECRRRMVFCDSVVPAFKLACDLRKPEKAMALFVFAKRSAMCFSMEWPTAEAFQAALQTQDGPLVSCVASGPKVAWKNNHKTWLQLVVSILREKCKQDETDEKEHSDLGFESVSDSDFGFAKERHMTEFVQAHPILQDLRSDLALKMLLHALRQEKNAELELPAAPEPLFFKTVQFLAWHVPAHELKRHAQEFVRSDNVSLKVFKWLYITRLNIACQTSAHELFLEACQLQKYDRAFVVLKHTPTDWIWLGWWSKPQTRAQVEAAVVESCDTALVTLLQKRFADARRADAEENAKNEVARARRNAEMKEHEVAEQLTNDPFCLGLPMWPVSTAPIRALQMPLIDKANHILHSLAPERSGPRPTIDSKIELEMKQLRIILDLGHAQTDRDKPVVLVCSGSNGGDGDNNEATSANTKTGLLQANFIVHHVFNGKPKPYKPFHLVSIPQDGPNAAEKATTHVLSHPNRPLFVVSNRCREVPDQVWTHQRTLAFSFDSLRRDPDLRATIGADHTSAIEQKGKSNDWFVFLRSSNLLLHLEARVLGLFAQQAAIDKLIGEANNIVDIHANVVARHSRAPAANF